MTSAEPKKHIILFENDIENNHVTIHVNEYTPIPPRICYTALRDDDGKIVELKAKWPAWFELTPKTTTETTT